jgi:hypothetical protein
VQFAFCQKLNNVIDFKIYERPVGWRLPIRLDPMERQGGGLTGGRRRGKLKPRISRRAIHNQGQAEFLVK